MKLSFFIILLIFTQHTSVASLLLGFLIPVLHAICGQHRCLGILSGKSCTLMTFFTFFALCSLSSLREKEKKAIY